MLLVQGQAYRQQYGFNSIYLLPVNLYGPPERIFVVGNPIAEVLAAYTGIIEASGALDRHGVQPGAYLLATLHRAENVDEPERLASLLEGMSRVAETLAMPLLVSLHPRTSDRMKAFGVIPGSARVQLLSPMGFADFVRLERAARLVLTDSGTVQEECCILRVPNVTLRDVTERAVISDNYFCRSATIRIAG